MLFRSRTDECDDSNLGNVKVKLKYSTVPGGWRRTKGSPNQERSVDKQMQGHHPEQFATNQQRSTQYLQQNPTLDQQGCCPLKQLPDSNLGPPPYSQSVEEIPRERPWRYRKETLLGHARGLGHGWHCPFEPDHPRQHPRGLGSGLHSPPELSHPRRHPITFMSISILISALGLFGMSVYYGNQQKRQIALRKVMGVKIVGFGVTKNTVFLRCFSYFNYCCFTKLIFILSTTL